MGTTPQPASSASEGHVEPRPEPAFPRRSRLAVLALTLSLLPVVSWASCATGLLDAEAEGAALWLASLPLALVGAILGFVNAHRLGRRPFADRPRDDRPFGRGMSLAAGILGLLSPVVTFFAGIPFVEITRGRRLVRRGKSRLPTTKTDPGWLDGPELPRLDAPEAAAAAWRENAATEHASVASFAHLSTQLIALGAPATLVEAAHQDALDEIRHARLCYGVARAIDGEEVGPAPFPWAVRPADEVPSFAQLAADALVEACLLEGASARLVAALAAADDVEPSIREVLRSIAADEGRHAAHGWHLIAWARAAGGAIVDEALARRLAAQPEHIEAALDPRWAEGQLERWGIPSRALWERCYADAYESVARRLAALIEGALAHAA